MAERSKSSAVALKHTWLEEPTEGGPVAEKARIGDVPQIHALIEGFATRDEMLHRPLSELYENIRDYLVIRDSSRVVACVALHVSWEDLAEIKAMAVAESHQGLGYGRILAEACLREAREMGIRTVFAFTYREGFFKKVGFSRVEPSSLPRKVWGECFRCSKFPNCDEVAMVYELEPS